MNRREQSIDQLTAKQSVFVAAISNLGDVEKIVTLCSVEKGGYRWRPPLEKASRDEHPSKAASFCDDTRPRLIVERINEHHTVGSSGYGMVRESVRRSNQRQSSPLVDPLFKIVPFAKTRFVLFPRFNTLSQKRSLDYKLEKEDRTIYGRNLLENWNKSNRGMFEPR